MILVLAFCAPIGVFAGEAITGVVEKTISNGSQINSSRIHYAHYIVDESMPAYQRTVNEIVSMGVQVSAEDEPKGTYRIDRSYFQHVLDDLESRFKEYVSSGNDVNEAPWSLIDSTSIQDEMIVNGKPTEIAQIYLEHYEFAGGAHGNSWTTVMHVSKNTGKKLNVLNDIILNEKEFVRIAEKHFRKQRKLGPKASLRKAGYDMDGGDAFVISQNIMFTDDSLVLIYNPYEIAPYVMGQIRVAIPLKDVEKIINVTAD
jgi:Protein of unknown function (DUF3298)